MPAATGVDGERAPCRTALSEHKALEQTQWPITISVRNESQIHCAIAFLPAPLPPSLSPDREARPYLRLPSGASFWHSAQCTSVAGIPACIGEKNEQRLQVWRECCIIQGERARGKERRGGGIRYRPVFCRVLYSHTALHSCFSPLSQCPRRSATRRVPFGFLPVGTVHRGHQECSGQIGQSAAAQGYEQRQWAEARHMRTEEKKRQQSDACSAVCAAVAANEDNPAALQSPPLWYPCGPDDHMGGPNTKRRVAVVFCPCRMQVQQASMHWQWQAEAGASLSALWPSAVLWDRSALDEPNTRGKREREGRRATVGRTEGYLSARAPFLPFHSFLPELHGLFQHQFFFAAAKEQTNEQLRPGSVTKTDEARAQRAHATAVCVSRV
jgi:hypothetical protein